MSTVSDNMNDELLRKECSDFRFYSFGTSAIFERRAYRLNRYLSVITFLGLAAPLTIGLFVGAYSTESEILKVIVLPIAGLITIFQAILSLWAIVSQWQNQLAYATNAASANTLLYSDFDRRCKGNATNLKKNIERSRESYTRQEQSDIKQHITRKEKLYAMRKSLLHFGSPCPTCGVRLQTLKPPKFAIKKCHTCGSRKEKGNEQQ